MAATGLTGPTGPSVAGGPVPAAHRTVAGPALTVPNALAVQAPSAPDATVGLPLIVPSGRTLIGRCAGETQVLTGATATTGPAALTGIPETLAGLGALAGMTGVPTGPAGMTVVPNGLAGTTAAALRAQDHDLVARRAPGPTAAELHRSRTI